MEIYVWIDRLNLQSKPKKHFARDFSDGVLCAEILMKTTTSVSSSSSRRSNTARMISMHNYPIKNSFKGKLENWELLNAKEKDEAISRLTVKVDALTAKCAKLEQLLELTKRKAIM
ncbi:unnamed protein product [Bathycoccus prasinos]